MSEETIQMIRSVFIRFLVIISDGEIGLFGLLEIGANVVLRAG
jgi:hypothetical protein